MADVVFNVAKARVKAYAELPLANDALIIVLLKAAQADATLVDHATLGALLGTAGNTQADATNYARKTISTGVTITVDNTNDRVDIDIPDQTWTALGGALNNSIVKLLVCYDNDTTAGTDTDIIPLTAHDFVVTTDGSDVTASIAAAGFFRGT